MTKNVLIVLAHPEPTSFSHAMTATAKKAFLENGYAVQISDLYAMDFDPVNDRRNFVSVKDEVRYHQGTEENHAVAVGGFNDSIQAEQAKLRWCDILIFQFPIHWFSMPAMLKGWVDKVLASGFAYGGGKWYDAGVFRGKRALLSLTTGAPGFMYTPEGVQGDIDELLYPINHGIFWFTGFTPIKPYVVYGPSHGDEKYREGLLHGYYQYIKAIESAPVIKYRGLDDFSFKTPTPEEARVSIPNKSAKMIATANGLIAAWAAGDRSAFARYVTTGLVIDTAAHNNISGLNAVWTLRESLGKEPLAPHACDTHTFPDSNTVEMYVHVLNTSTGARKELSKYTLSFTGDNEKIFKYQQTVLFAVK